MSALHIASGRRSRYFCLFLSALAGPFFRKGAKTNELFGRHVGNGSTICFAHKSKQVKIECLQIGNLYMPLAEGPDAWLRSLCVAPPPASGPTTRTPPNG